MPSVSESLKAKILNQEVPVSEVPTPTMSPEEIATNKVGYPGEDEVDQLALNVYLNKVALQMLAKEVSTLKSIIMQLIQASKQ
jgi:hypothetical protein